MILFQHKPFVFFVTLIFVGQEARAGQLPEPSLGYPTTGQRVPVTRERTKDGYVIEKDADPDQGKFSVYTSIYDLEKLFEKEQEYITHINTIIEKKLVGNHAETGLGMYSAR